jgi:general secretion pathway protein G
LEFLSATNRIVCTQAGFAVAQMERLLSGLDAYARANGGQYPDSLEALLELDSEGRPFLENAMSLPLDPWGHPYVYSPPLNGAEPRVISYGRDGKPGGDHQNADIDSGAPQRDSSSAWE